MRVSRRQFLQVGGAALAACALPLPALAGESQPVPALLYGDVSHRFRDELTVAPPQLAAQLEWLASSGYRTVTAGELSAREAKQSEVFLAFDGGYASFATLAYPLLQGYGFRATLCLPGDAVLPAVGSESVRPRISWDECRLLAAGGLVELACATHALHRRGSLRSIPAAELADDLGRFQETLRRETGRPASTLAWPFGLDDERQREAARAAGFTTLLTEGEGAPHRDRGILTMPCRRINGRVTLANFRKIVGGEESA